MKNAKNNHSSFDIICNILNKTSSQMKQTIPVLIFLTQAVIIDAYNPGMSAACYYECSSNCTTYEPFLCTLDFIPGIFLIAGTGTITSLIGLGLGYSLNYCFDYMKDSITIDQTLNEKSLLINN